MIDFDFKSGTSRSKTNTLPLADCNGDRSDGQTEQVVDKLFHQLPNQVHATSPS
ncbi:hypothetical protein DPMN_149819 [Dreissena polymorpha]|uniref:Uncharacterized protein n=1 Tax=Dreissena polymorpha TaxID=45954 RepID=A0A9D4J1G1_DREPO|nr:hypothetical protein DPMN_149819 [Dreissena polymorpha]